MVFEASTKVLFAGFLSSCAILWTSAGFRRLSLRVGVRVRSEPSDERTVSVSRAEVACSAWSTSVLSKSVLGRLRHTLNHQSTA